MKKHKNEASYTMRLKRRWQRWLSPPRDTFFLDHGDMNNETSINTTVFTDFLIICRGFPIRNCIVYEHPRVYTDGLTVNGHPSTAKQTHATMLAR
jgi:hypothetical protein